jgi:hypothetical protein
MNTLRTRDLCTIEGSSQRQDKGYLKEAHDGWFMPRLS